MTSFNTLNCHQHIHTPYTPNQTPIFGWYAFCMYQTRAVGTVFDIDDSFLGQETPLFCPPQFFFEKNAKNGLFSFFVITCHLIDLEA